jgi:hypothetical protein
VSAAYINFVQNGTDFNGNVSSFITTFSYRGLLNYSGGSLLQCIFITAIFMYIIDRKFIRATVWSLLAAIFALFGLINSAGGVGILVKSNDYGWRFAVGYAMMGILFGCLEIAQRRGWVKQSETEPDDLSMNKWNQEQVLKDKNGSENSLLIEK